MSEAFTTAARASLLSCHTCRQLSLARRMPPGSHAVCSRCGTTLHFRKPNSLARTWALTLTAFILYIPANLLPIMTVISYGEGAPDTIMSGVIHLIEAEMYPIALLVFFASVTVPVAKLMAISYLLISVQKKSRWRPKDRTVMYRVTESIGRWSMLDIFMIALLAALVKLGAIATIEPGLGAVCFAGVVVITMFAAMSFDPRLIWDAMEEKR